MHLSTFRLRILFHMSQDSPLTTQVFRRREDRMGPEKASRPNGGKSPHAGDSQDVIFSRNQVIKKKNWWFDCTLRPKTGTFTTLSKITAVSERYLFLPNFSHFSFAPVLTKPSFSYTKMTEVISHAQLLVCLHGPAAMKVSGL